MESGWRRLSYCFYPHGWTCYSSFVEYQAITERSTLSIVLFPSRNKPVASKIKHFFLNCLRNCFFFTAFSFNRFHILLDLLWNWNFRLHRSDRTHQSHCHRSQQAGSNDRQFYTEGKRASIPVKMIPFSGEKNTMFRFSNSETSCRGTVTLAILIRARDIAT